MSDRSLADFLGSLSAADSQQVAPTTFVDSQISPAPVALGRIEFDQSGLSRSQAKEVLSSVLAKLISAWQTRSQAEWLSRSQAEWLSYTCSQAEEMLDRGLAELVKPLSATERGQKGGQRRAARLSPERRHEIAQHARRTQLRLKKPIGFAPPDDGEYDGMLD